LADQGLRETQLRPYNTQRIRARRLAHRQPKAQRPAAAPHDTAQSSEEGRANVDHQRAITAMSRRQQASICHRRRSCGCPSGGGGASLRLAGRCTRPVPCAGASLRSAPAPARLREAPPPPEGHPKDGPRGEIEKKARTDSAARRRSAPDRRRVELHLIALRDNLHEAKAGRRPGSQRGHIKLNERPGRRRASELVELPCPPSRVPAAKRPNRGRAHQDSTTGGRQEVRGAQVGVGRYDRTPLKLPSQHQPPPPGCGRRRQPKRRRQPCS